MTDDTLDGKIMRQIQSGGVDTCSICGQITYDNNLFCEDCIEDDELEYFEYEKQKEKARKAGVPLDKIDEVLRDIIF